MADGMVYVLTSEHGVEGVFTDYLEAEAYGEWMKATYAAYRMCSSFFVAQAMMDPYRTKGCELAPADEHDGGPVGTARYTVR